ncbi:hypothetical protein P7C73_g532, partial [Tremellales sp. Uapishka_1]
MPSTPSVEIRAKPSPRKPASKRKSSSTTSTPEKSPLRTKVPRQSKNGDSVVRSPSHTPNLIGAIRLILGQKSGVSLVLAELERLGGNEYTNVKTQLAGVRADLLLCEVEHEKIKAQLRQVVEEAAKTTTRTADLTKRLQVYENWTPPILNLARIASPSVSTQDKFLAWKHLQTVSRRLAIILNLSSSLPNPTRDGTLDRLHRWEMKTSSRNNKPPCAKILGCEPWIDTIIDGLCSKANNAKVTPLLAYLHSQPPSSTIVPRALLAIISIQQTFLLSTMAHGQQTPVSILRLSLPNPINVVQARTQTFHMQASEVVTNSRSYPSREVESIWGLICLNESSSTSWWLFSIHPNIQSVCVYGSDIIKAKMLADTISSQFRLECLSDADLNDFQTAGVHWVSTLPSFYPKFASWGASTTSPDFAVQALRRIVVHPSVIHTGVNQYFLSSVDSSFCDTKRKPNTWASDHVSMILDELDLAYNLWDVVERGQVLPVKEQGLGISYKRL